MISAGMRAKGDYPECPNCGKKDWQIAKEDGGITIVVCPCGVEGMQVDRNNLTKRNEAFLQFLQLMEAKPELREAMIAKMQEEAEATNKPERRYYGHYI